MHFNCAGHSRTGLLWWFQNHGFTGKAWGILESLLVRLLGRRHHDCP